MSRANSGDIAARAEALLLEQTVELSRAAASDAWVRENIVGEVLSIEPRDGGRFAVAIAQPLAHDGARSRPVPQRRVRQFVVAARREARRHRTARGILRDVQRTALRRERPARKTRRFRSRPDRHGAEAHGLAARRNSRRSPMLSRIAGIDVIKDDHGLADHDFCPFEARVELASARSRRPTPRPAARRSTRRT